MKIEHQVPNDVEALFEDKVTLKRKLIDIINRSLTTKNN